MDIADVLKSKRHEVLQIAREYGAYDVRVFGSVARGEAQPDSDIDFLVEMESGRSLLDLGGLVIELQPCFSTTDVLRTCLFRSEVHIWAGESKSVRSWCSSTLVQAQNRFRD